MNNHLIIHIIYIQNEPSGDLNYVDYTVNVDASAINLQVSDVTPVSVSNVSEGTWIVRLNSSETLSVDQITQVVSFLFSYVSHIFLHSFSIHTDASRSRQA